MPPNKQPHKHRTYDTRARMFLRGQLSWLWGYPIKVTKNNIQWQILYFPEPWDVSEVIIDGIAISKTIRAKNRLIRDFPKALPRVVGDVKQWSHIQEIKLSAVKNLLAHKAVDPWQEIIYFIAPNRLFKQGKQLRSSHPSLATLIDIFAWCLSGNIKELQKALAWLDKNSTSLMLINDHYPNPNRLILELFYLEQKIRTKYVQPLVKTIANEDFIHFFTINGGAWGVLSTQTIEVKKADRVEDTLLIQQQKKQQTLKNISAFIFSLNTRPVAQRRQSLILFSLLVNNDSLRYLRQTFESIDVMRPLLKKLLFGNNSSVKHKQLDDQCTQLQKKLIHTHLPAIDSKHFFSLIQWLITNDKTIPLLQKMESLLLSFTALQSQQQDDKYLPWKHPMVMLFWVEYLKEIILPDSISVHIFQRTLNHYLADSTSLEQRLKRFQPWSDLLHKTPLNPHDQHPYVANILGYGEHHFYINNSAGTTNSLSSYFLLLGKLSDHSKEIITSKTAQNLFNFHSYSSPDHPVFEYYLEACKVRASLKYCYQKEYTQLHKAAQGDPALFAYFYKLWTVPLKPLTDDSLDEFIWDENRENSVEMLSKLAELGYQKTALYLSQQQNYGTLKSTAGLVDVFSEIKLTLPHPQSYLKSHFPDWLAHYPDALNRGLFCLVKYHSNAEKVANDILGSDFPRPENLQSQIDYLHAQDKVAESSSFNKRIRQLQKRINNPIKVSTPRLNKLDKKLHHAAHTALTSNWHKQLETNLYKQIHHSLQKSEAIQVADIDPRYLKTLTALLPLKNKIKAQGYQLILNHAGYTQWDYYQEDENQKFLQKLTEKGINSTPWLEQKSHDFTQVVNGKSIHLRLQLEQDVLALFYMGSHFSTCLSHYDFNFFSVIANIIDINKQIIYAYDNKGRIQGRCLIALTDAGKILNYHYYSHHKNDSFKIMANKFINQLAKDMGTSRTAKGYPSKLIAHDWYDDIANDYRQLSRILEEGSKLDKQLVDIKAEDFLAVLTKAIHPCKLSATALELIINMSFFRKRPDLCLQLLNKVQNLPESSYEIRFEFASNLIKIEQHAALSLLGKWFVRYAIKRLRDWDWKVDELLELLLTMSPTITLRVLQKSRPSCVRSWQDESSGQRLYAAAQAFDQLKRLNQALTLFKLALNISGWEKLNEKQKMITRGKIKHLNEKLTLN